MCKLNLTDDLNAIASVVDEAKSVADLASHYIDNIDVDLFENSKKNQILSVVEAISRILLIVNDKLMKLSNHYSFENDDKFSSIVSSYITYLSTAFINCQYPIYGIKYGCIIPSFIFYHLIFLQILILPFHINIQEL